MYEGKKDQFPMRLSEKHFPRRLSILFLASLSYMSFSETIITKRDENTFRSVKPTTRAKDNSPNHIRRRFKCYQDFKYNDHYTNQTTLSHTWAFCLELPLVVWLTRFPPISPRSYPSPLEAHYPQSP